MRYIYGVITGYVLCLFVNLYGWQNIVNEIAKLLKFCKSVMDVLMR